MTVDQYINKLDDWKKEAAQKLRALIKRECPDAEEAIKWSQPTYEYHGPLCYISAHKKQVNIGFARGADLEDPYNLLEGTGKQMRHVKIFNPDEVDNSALAKLIEEAMALNENP